MQRIQTYILSFFITSSISLFFNIYLYTYNKF